MTLFESTDVMGLEFLVWAETVRKVRVDHEDDMQAIADASEAAALKRPLIAAEELGGVGGDKDGG